jgi:hypothetical protein
MSFTTYFATALLGVIAFPSNRIGRRADGAALAGTLGGKPRDALPFARSSLGASDAHVASAPRVEPVLELQPVEVLQQPQLKPAISRPQQRRAPPGRSPPPRAAAAQFVQWLQECDATGDIAFGLDATAKTHWRRHGLHALYLAYCKEANIVPLQRNQFGEALAGQLKQFVVRDYTTGKLRRLTFYRVPDVEAAEAKAAAKSAPAERRKRAA